MALLLRSRSRPAATPQAGDAGTGASIRFVSLPVRWVAAGWRRAAVRRAHLADLRAGLALAPRERLLAAGAGPDGGCTLAATDRALYHRAHGGAWTRLGWEQIAAVSWAAVGRVVVTGLAPHARVVIPLRDRGSVPEVARERLAHARLGSWQVTAPGGQRLLIRARRRPVTGEMLWFVAADGALCTGALRAHAEQAIVRLSADSGLPRAAPVSLPWPARR
jgi:hypothetical protein